MKKNQFFFYAFLLLGAGLAGCKERDITQFKGDWSQHGLMVHFDPIKLNTGNDVYEAQSKHGDYWSVIYTQNSEIRDFADFFGERGLHKLSAAYIKATTKSSRGSKDVTHTNTGRYCQDYHFYVWADGYDNSTILSQELNIEFFSGPHRDNAGNHGNLYWTKKMLAKSYTVSDITWKDELKEEAIFKAGSLDLTAVFKTVTYSGSGSSTSTSSTTGATGTGISGTTPGNPGSGNSTVTAQKYTLTDSQFKSPSSSDNILSTNKLLTNELLISANQTAVSAGKLEVFATATTVKAINDAALAR